MKTQILIFFEEDYLERVRRTVVVGLLSSMYAFAPAFGFALSAAVTQLSTTIFDGINSEDILKMSI